MCLSLKLQNDKYVVVNIIQGVFIRLSHQYLFVMEAVGLCERFEPGNTRIHPVLGQSMLQRCSRCLLT